MRRRLVTTMVLGLAAAWTATAAAQQSAEERFQAALYQEEVQGDLKGAIAAYQRVLREHAENRAVAAKAQLHIGLCYEKLGLGDARRAYLGVIDGFPEQADVVAMAQRRLASLAHELDELRRQPTFTKIEIASKPQNGVLSADGQRLAFVDQGALWVVPLHGNVDPTIAGGPVRIAEAPGIWDYWSQTATNYQEQ